MYCEHFGLTDYPFRRSGEAAVPSVGSSFRTAYGQIEDGVEAGIGLQLLVGPPGTGKTRLLACVESRFGDRYRVLRPNFTGFSESDFIEKLAEGLGSGAQPGDPDEAAAALATVLEREAAGPRGLLLLIDDAERLGRATLESLPDLFSLGDAARPARARIVLAACPDFEQHLLDWGLEPLWASVDRTCRLEPLDEEEIREYILDAMDAAGYQGEPVFADEAIARIAERSAGVPRRINNLCGVALLVAYENGVHCVGADLVDEGAATLVSVSETADREPAAVSEAAGPAATTPGARPGTTAGGLSVDLIDRAMGGIRTLRDEGRQRIAAAGGRFGQRAIPPELRDWAAGVWRSIGLGALVLALVAVVVAVLPWPQERPGLTAAPEKRMDDQAPEAAGQIAALERALERAATERRDLRATIRALAGSLAQVETRMQSALSVSPARSGAAPQAPSADVVPSPPEAETPRATASRSASDAVTAPPAEDSPPPAAAPRAVPASADTEAAAAEPSRPAGPGPGASPAPAARYLVVSKGDTLWTIARRHGLSVAELSRTNRVNSAKPLYPGQRLKVPARMPGAGGAAKRPEWYTVRRGDSLSSIGRRFDVPVETLTRWNRLDAPDALQPGQRLLVARADGKP